MSENTMGNEALVALVLVNACAAFAILSAFGPENTRPFVVIVATMMGLGAFCPIFRLLQQPQRYVIRKEKQGDLESYVLRFKGYLWWYDAKNKDGQRLAFNKKEDAIDYVRKNVITRLINQKIRQQRHKLKKAKKEYETVVDPLEENLDVENLLNQKETDPKTHPQKETENENENTPKKRGRLIIDNKSSLQMLNKQIQSSKGNQQDTEDSNDDPKVDPKHDEEIINEMENEEGDEKPLGEIIPDPAPQNTMEGGGRNPVKELMDAYYNEENAGNEENTGNEEKENIPQTQENKENGKQENNDAENKKVLTLSNENPIQRFGPESVTEVMNKILFHNQMKQEKEGKEKQNANKKQASFNSSQKANAEDTEGVAKTKRKGRKKSYDDGVMKMRQMTIYDELADEEKNNQPPEDKTSSSGQKVVKKLDNRKPPEIKTDKDDNNIIKPLDEQKQTEDFQDGSEIIVEEPDERLHSDNNTSNATEDLEPNGENVTDIDNIPELTDDIADDDDVDASENIWEADYIPPDD